MTITVTHSTAADSSFSATGAAAWNADHSFTGILDVANGGTGTTTPALVAGTNVTITGTWPNQTIAASGGSGSGTVTSVSVTSANGFAGSVTNATTTPAITVSTSITGVLKGNGTAISAASAGTDYQAPITLTTTGTSGAATFVSNTLNIPQYSGGGGSGTVTSVDATVPAFLSVTGGPITTTGTLAISYSGTALPIANGGTGATTQQAAINALAGSVQNSRFLAGNGTNVTMRAIAVVDVPTLNQDTTGTAANVTGTVAIANGGTGQITKAAGFNALSPITTTGDLILGNGANSATRLAIGANGYVLTSDGTTASWAAGGGGGSVTISNDTATASNLYPAFFAATSGTASTAYTSNAKLLYKPSTGEFQSTILTGTVNATNTFGFKNRLINGLMQIAQRATSGTSGSAVPTTAPTYPSVDRWYAYATGATVTVARVAGSNANQYNLQATGAASVTAVGIGQRIEQSNSYDMAGSTATLSVNISNSLLTTVTWTANYATSADTWSSKTQIATGTFTVNSTLTNYNAQISIPSAATTGIEILFTVGAQTSGTWVIGNVQLEKSSVATSFDYISYGAMLALCYRYYYKIGAGISNGFNTFGLGYVESSTSAKFIISFPVSMRIPPTALEQSGTAANYAVRYTNVGFQNCSAVPTHDSGTYWTASFDFTVASGLTGGQAIMGRTGNSTGTNAYLAWSAEL